MTYCRENRDLFTVGSEYHLCHCISGDYALGAGIAKIFREKYDMRAKLNRDFPNSDDVTFHIGSALLVDNVFNLVTKGKCFGKPTYENLENALIDMRNQCDFWNIKKLAMPKIGCGLDRLDWDVVEALIKKTFADLDIEILVCEI